MGQQYPSVVTGPRAIPARRPEVAACARLRRVSALSCYAWAFRQGHEVGGSRPGGTAEEASPRSAGGWHVDCEPCTPVPFARHAVDSRHLLGHAPAETGERLRPLPRWSLRDTEKLQHSLPLLFKIFTETPERGLRQLIAPTSEHSLSRCYSGLRKPKFIGVNVLP